MPSDTRYTESCAALRRHRPAAAHMQSVMRAARGAGTQRAPSYEVSARGRLSVRVKR